MSKKFEISWQFVSWTDISLGVNLDLKMPRIEIHIPFGFIAIGWREFSGSKPLNWRMLTTKYLVGNPHWEHRS